MRNTRGAVASASLPTLNPEGGRASGPGLMAGSIGTPSAFAILAAPKRSRSSAPTPSPWCAGAVQQSAASAILAAPKRWRGSRFAGQSAGLSCRHRRAWPRGHAGERDEEYARRSGFADREFGSPAAPCAQGWCTMGIWFGPVD